MYKNYVSKQSYFNCVPTLYNNLMDFVSHQAPLSMGFSRQKYWSSCHSLLQGIVPTQGSNPGPFCFLHWQVDSLPLAPPGKPPNYVYPILNNQELVIDREAWCATIHRVAKCWTWLSDWTDIKQQHLEVHGSHTVEAWLGEFWSLLISMWDEYNCVVVWAFFGIAFLWDWNENWPFLVLWPLLSFPNLLAYWVQHFHSIIFLDLK